MKRILLIICLGFLAFFNHAQLCGQLISSSVIPISPVAGQDSWLNLQVYCNQGYFIQNSDVTFSGNTVTVNAFYCQSMIQVITYTNDSIPLGQLPAGAYTYFVNIFTSDINCQSYSQTDQASGNWTVTNPSASYGDLEAINLHIYPNPVENTLQIDRKSPEACKLNITDVSGRIFHEQNLTSTHDIIALPASMVSGFYYVSIFSSEGQLQSTHTIIRR